MRRQGDSSRRTFFSKIGKGVLAAGAVQILGLRKAAASPLENPIVLDLALPANSALTSVGGSKYVDHPQDFNPIIVVRVSDTQVAAYSSTCTHQGCQVPLPIGGAITCPCHGSTYDTLGRVTGGPALENLEYFQATLQDNVILINNPGITTENMSLPRNTAPFTLRQTMDAVVLTATRELKEWSASVMGADGRLVARMTPEGPGLLKWNTRTAAAGVYFIEVKISGNKFIRRIAVP